MSKSENITGNEIRITKRKTNSCSPLIAIPRLPTYDVRRVVSRLLARSPQLATTNEKHQNIINTVKASNFGSHGNFGPFFSEGLAIIETRVTEK